MSTSPNIPSLSSDPGFEYYFKACRKGDLEAKAVAVGYSPIRVLAKASEVTALPRDNFEIHEISKAEFETAKGNHKIKLVLANR